MQAVASLTHKQCNLPRARLLRRSIRAVVLLLFASSFFAASAEPPPVALRVSAWYWLNSVPKSQWAADFQAMRELGLTDVMLVWGLDASAFATRTADSHQAIRAAQKAGLGSYLFVWHARHNALPHARQFEQVDADGQSLYAFDTFNPQWRKTQWKSYLQKLAREYGREPGMAGYVFDNSFAIGNIGEIDGPPPPSSASYLSYGAVEQKAFGKPLPHSPQDLAWAEWTKARQQWWADWAADTRRAIRGIDRNQEHKIVLEDGENTIDPEAQSRAGFALRTVIESFDNMHAYWAPDYSNSSDPKSLADGVTTYLTRMREAVGAGKDLSLSLRLSESSTEDEPGGVTKPTFLQVKTVIDAARAMGIREIDLYGYRMGVYHLDGPGWRQYRPGAADTYPLTGQIEGKFLIDRPALRDDLKAYLKSSP